MFVQTTIYIREIENGFVIGHGNRNTLAGPSNTEHYFPDLETLSSDARGIIFDAINEARQDAAEARARMEENRLRYPDQCESAASQRSQGAVVGRPY